MAVVGLFFLAAHSGRAVAADPMVAAVGDMACAPTNPEYNGGDGTDDACRQRYVSDLVADLAPAGLLDLGDNQYATGDLLSFQAVYDPTFGRANTVVYPALGNAEYETPGAQGFFDYFASVGVADRIDSGGTRTAHFYDGYYSFDIGTWHLIALNSNCAQVGGCYSGSTQEKWLKADLAANPDRCTLAYWHHPRWNTGSLGNDSSSAAFWTDLYAAHADVVLNGHGNHHYERFAPQNPSGVTDASNGLREFIVSTGGESHGWPPGSGGQGTSQVTDYTSFGILRLTLSAGSYNWKFLPAAGDSFTDSGSGSCHWTTAQPPATPVLSASSAGNTVHLSWTPPADGGSPIKAYKVYRGTSPGAGALLKALGNVTSYDDNAVTNGTKYYYRVAAANRVGDGNQSNEALGAQPPATPSVAAEPGDRMVHLSWSAPADGGSPITGYKIYRGTTSGGETLLKSVGSVDSYDDTSLTNGKRYYYRLSAGNSVGQGSQSAEVSQTPAAVPAAPSVAATVAGGAVHLSWTPPADGGAPITGYRVFRADSPGNETLLTSTQNVTSADDNSLITGITYYYRVAAVNSMGQGARSAVVTAGLPLPFVPVLPPLLGNPAGAVVGALKLAPSTFVAVRSGAKGAAARGAQVTYTLSAPAVITFRVERALTGVSRSGGCVKPTGRKPRGKRCTLFARLRGSFEQAGVKGLNGFCFTGRFAGRSLARGSYTLVAERHGPGQVVASSAHSRFRIVRRVSRGEKGCTAK